MQLLYIFRGCLLAYAFGVFAVSIGNMVAEGPSFESFGIIALFGTIVLLPFLFVVVVIWAILAGLEKTVSRWQAAAMCAGVFFFAAFLLGLAGGGLLGLLAGAVIMPVVGAVFGLIFWVGAFGFRREMPMGTRMPEDWW